MTYVMTSLAVAKVPDQRHEQPTETGKCNAKQMKYLVSAAALTAGLVASTATTGNWDYHCSYAHWRSGAKVTWRCDLYVCFLEDDACN